MADATRQRGATNSYVEVLLKCIGSLFFAEKMKYIQRAEKERGKREDE